MPKRNIKQKNQSFESENNNLYLNYYKNISEDANLKEEQIKSTKTQINILGIFFLSIIIIVLIVLVVLGLTILPLNPEIKIKIKTQPIENFQSEKELQIYIENCLKGILLDKTKYAKLSKPKISIIIPVYNKKDCLLRLLRSIQNQLFKEIEIIFCDDYSTDGSIALIELYKKEDERIVLIKHEKNMGTLITRNDGAMKSKGKFLLFVDSDDMIIGNILNTSYTNAIKHKVDILQFKVYNGNFASTEKDYRLNRSSSVITQPKLSNLMFYEKGYLYQTEYNIWGNLIRKKTFKLVLKSIADYYLKQHMTSNEDGLIIFMLYKKARSYYYIGEYGLFYIKHKNKEGQSFKTPKIINKNLKDSFLYLEFMYHYTNDTIQEKNIVVYKFFSIMNDYKGVLYLLNDGFDYIYKIINLYLNCFFISEQDKNEIDNYKGKFELIENNIKKGIENKPDLFKKITQTNI